MRNKKYNLIVVIIALLIFTIFFAGCSRGVPVSFKDNNFASVIRDHLDSEKRGEIRNRELQSIEELYIYNTGEEIYRSLDGYVKPGENISSLSGIEHLKNLESLLIYGSRLDDIKVLRKLKSLSSIELKETEVEDITPLSYLPNLQTLILEKNNIKNIEPLEFLEDLRILILNEKRIDDFSPLLELDNLVYIKIGAEEAENLDKNNNRNIVNKLKDRGVKVRYTNEDYDYGQ